MKLERMDEFFAARVNGYDEHMRTTIEGASEFYAFTASLLPMGSGTRVLDLGCGTGLELEEYFRLNPDADEVAKYRQYDEDGNETLGEYGRVFEEAYESALKDYRTFLDADYLAYLDGITAHETHRGYFSIDKKTGHAVESTLKRGSEFSNDT